MAELSKKVYSVQTPKDGVILIHAKSSTAAVAGVREHLRAVENWSATLATPTQCIEAGRAGTEILDYDAPDEAQQALPIPE